MSTSLLRDVEIVWEDLLDAFENDDGAVVYFLDRSTGEVFFVPVDYDDEAFWAEIDSRDDNFLPIPSLDHDQERALLHEFIKEVTNDGLKQMLQAAFSGKRPYGRLEEILSFYPEELEKLVALRDEATANRIRRWLEENDLYPVDQSS